MTTAGAAESAPLIFIHGIKGSSLVDASGHARWLTGAQGLGLCAPELRSPLEWDEAGRQRRDELRAEAPLDSVRILFGLIQQKIYLPWSEAARASDRPYFPFAYDWRRDNLESLAEFERFVAEVRARSGGARVQVVAHSMGGLLTLALLNRHPEHFASVVFAGVPFGGGIGFLPDLHAGAPVGWNSRILAPAVLFTYPSVYSLFPLRGARTVDREGRALTVDFFAARDWRAQKLGAFAPGAESAGFPPPDAAEAFLARALAKAREFRELLVARPIAYPPILVVSGDGRPTLVTAMRDGPRSERGWDFASAPTEPGDGRVSLRDSLPPKGIAYRALRIRSEHGDLLGDPAVIEAVRALGTPAQ